MEPPALQADAWFSIGETHRICEDFALAGVDEARAFAVVCDGCSSSPQTDVGARLIALAARAALRRGELPDEQVVRTAARSLAPLDADSRCLDATLLVALADDTRCRVRVFGDGVVVARRRDGTLEISEFSQPDGAPVYPAYTLSPARWCAWLERWTNVTIEFRYHDGRRFEHRTPPELEFAARDYAEISLASDGLGAFVQSVDGVSQRLSPADVAPRLFAFKQTTGSFAARRGRRFIRRECPREGWHPMDDVAVASIVMEAP